MKVKLALLVAALQVIVLAFMGGQREWIMRTGTPLVLRTAPVDPNDPKLRTFVTVARDSHFPIQNLPYGVFTTPANYSPRVGVAIGDQVLDLSVLEQAGLLDVVPGERLFNRPTLNAFIERGPDVWKRARAAISDLLRQESARLRDDARGRARAVGARSGGLRARNDGRSARHRRRDRGCTVRRGERRPVALGQARLGPVHQRRRHPPRSAGGGSLG